MNDGADSIRVTLDAPLTHASRDAFTTRHGLTPSPGTPDPATWHAGHIHVSADPAARTWTFTTTRGTGRAQAETAALARDLWHQHGGALTATPAMRHRLTQPPPPAPRPLDRLTVTRPGGPQPLTTASAADLTEHLTSQPGQAPGRHTPRHDPPGTG